MTPDGYPEEDELEAIRTWPAEDFVGLMAYVRERWTFPHYFHVEGGVYRLSTCGWSGNEELLGALHENTVVGLMHWYASRRGGHEVWATREAMQGMEGWPR